MLRNSAPYSKVLFCLINRSRPSLGRYGMRRESLMNGVTIE